MRSPGEQPGDEPTQDQDPLSAYSAPSVRRPADQGETQPLDALPGRTPRSPATQGEGGDFAARPRLRRQRQSTSRVYPRRFGEMTRRVDNRQLFLIGGAIVLLLIALLAWQASRRGADLPATIAPDREPAAESTAVATAATGASQAGALVTTEPQDTVQTVTAASGASAGTTFVVTGTGTAGLFLRAEPSTTANKVATLPDGTRVEALGEERNDGTYTWRKVRTPQGEGWVADQFLQAEP